MDWHTGETIACAAERISTEAKLDEGHDAPAFCYVLLHEAARRVTRSEAGGERGRAIRDLDASLALVDAIIERAERVAA